MKPALPFLFVILLFQGLRAQTTWYVRAGASPVGADASSWATATPYLQDALDAAQFGDAIWIAAGTYKPDASGNRNVSFLLKNGVGLYGGFAGFETELEQRDWEANPTVLSGDIGAPGDSTDNSYCILYAAKTGFSTRIDGLVIEAGNAGNPDNVNVFAHQPGHSGSAVYLDGQGAGNFAYLTIAHCLIRRNRADYFGAVYANGRDNGKTSLVVENSLFERNKAGFKGGGIVVENYAFQPEPLRLSGAVFRDNYGRSGGGALYVEHHQNIEMNGCRFERNEVFAGTGGAISLFAYGQSNTVRFRNCAFTGNFTTNNLDGGAIFYYIFSGNTALDFDNCSFTENKASEGGCINLINALNGQCPLRFNQCLFVRNNALGSILTSSLEGPLGNIRFVQCAFYENSGQEFFVAFNQSDSILLYNSILIKSPGSLPFLTGANPVLADHCLLNRPGCADLGPNAICAGGMLFNGKPFFVNPDAGDFHLSPCSPAINAGANNLAAGLSADFEGQPRIRAGVVDLGPYEHDLGFVPTVLTPASCPDASDGSVVFGGSHCSPVLITWSKGDMIGTRTDSLAPGLYVFSFIDAVGHSDIDTVLIPSLPGLLLQSEVVQPTCVGQQNGIAAIDVSGGTPPYQISWGGGNTGNFLFNVPAGTYTVSVVDARGCKAQEPVLVPEPGPVSLFYTVTPASGPNQADGAISVDSVSGCMGPFAWPNPPLLNLSPGTYPITVTDPCGCVQVYPVSVGFAVSTEAAPEQDAGLALAPNPAQAGQAAVLRWNPGFARVQVLRIQDAAGRVLQRIAVPPGVQEASLTAPNKAGLYRVVLEGEAGLIGSLGWAITR